MKIIAEWQWTLQIVYKYDIYVDEICLSHMKVRLDLKLLASLIFINSIMLEIYIF